MPRHVNNFCSGGVGRGSTVSVFQRPDTEFPFTRNILRDLPLNRESPRVEENFPLFADAWSSPDRPSSHSMDNDLFIKGGKGGKWENGELPPQTYSFPDHERCTLKMAVFWVVAPCSLVEVYQRFRGPCCLHHQGDE
jgi:hypothetical protein